MDEMASFKVPGMVRAARAAVVHERHNGPMTMPPWQPVTEHRDQLGESPFWHPDEGRVYWVDIPGRALRRLDPRTSLLDSWPMPHEPGCIAPVRGGGLVIAL